MSEGPVRPKLGPTDAGGSRVLERTSRPTPSGFDVEGIGLGPIKLEDLVDRDALREMADSFEKLFGVPVRFLSASGGVLGDATTMAAICAYVGEHPDGRRACNTTVAQVKSLGAEPGRTKAHPCFTGAQYRVVPIEYDGRVLGRVILGPFLPKVYDTVPPSLLIVDDHIDPDKAHRLLPTIAQVDPERIDHLATHLVSVLDVILFSGHRALLTSKMHLAATRESYRELETKNAKLEEAYERLKELDRLKSNFLATISHELRTPLTSIMGYSEMLAEGIGGPLNAEQAEFIQTIRTKSDQLLGLIMSLLDLSKLESGTALMRRTDVPLVAILEDALSTVAPTAQKKRVALAVSAPDDLPGALGDPDRLRQVFINLVENAVKFTPGGGSVTLAARAVTRDPIDEPGLVLVAPLRQAVEVRCIDTGVGIPVAERVRVFDPFYQVDQSSTREHGGTGLGLSIVKRLVEAHQGTIEIEANEPSGAVFVVTLPVARTSFPPPVRQSVPPAGPSPSVPPVFS